jgi:uncharacterized protein with PIN domain
MSVPFYFDQHVPVAIAHALRLRGVSVLTASQDGHDRSDDEPLLLRATASGRILFTQDEDLLAIAHRFQIEDRHFAGLVYPHQMRVSIGRCIVDLEIIAKASSVTEMANRVEFLPL